MTSISCEDAIERLPWLLNGTLSEDERVSLEGHLESCEPCRLAVEETRAAWRIFSQHLLPEQLVAWAGADEPADEGGVQGRHLETCAQCAADLELVRMSRRLVEEDGVALLLPVKRTAAGGERGWRRAALAAGLAAAVMGGGWLVSAARVGRLDGELARQPVASGAAESNLAIVTLSAGSERGDAPQAPTLRQDCSGWTFVLAPPGSAPPATVRAELYDAHDRAVLDWGDEVHLLEGQGYTVKLKRGIFAGPHTLRIFRREAGKWEPYGRFPVTLP